jgi:S1-C subfamily serine protease
VAGINTAVIPFARGIGFAVPAHTANWVVAVLLTKGRVVRPLIGIAARGVELGRRQAVAGRSRAVYVENVASASPALRAGVRAEDLLLSANGQALASVDDLQRVLVLSEGAPLTVELLRQQSRLTVTVRPELRAAA